VEIIRSFEGQDLDELARDFGVEVEAGSLAEGRFGSAFIRARRPN